MDWSWLRFEEESAICSQCQVKTWEVFGLNKDGKLVKSNVISQSSHKILFQGDNVWAVKTVKCICCFIKNLWLKLFNLLILCMIAKQILIAAKFYVKGMDWKIYGFKYN